MDSELILDSTAFYAGIPFSSSETFHTSPSVLGEVTGGRSVAMRVEILVRSERLIVRDPRGESLDEARDVSKRVEGMRLLSEADLSVLALALDLLAEGRRSIIVTDDYSIQNVARAMNLEYRPVLFRGIKDEGSWMVFCPGCGRSYGKRIPKVCDSCGSELKRRFRRGSVTPRR